MTDEVQRKLMGGNAMVLLNLKGASAMTAEYVVANVEDVPEGDTCVIVEVKGREIGLFNVKGQYYALANICFHQNGPLCRGATRSGTVVTQR